MPLVVLTRGLAFLYFRSLLSCGSVRKGALSRVPLRQITGHLVSRGDGQEDCIHTLAAVGKRGIANQPLDGRAFAGRLGRCADSWLSITGNETIRLGYETGRVQNPFLFFPSQTSNLTPRLSPEALAFCKGEVYLLKLGVVVQCKPQKGQWISSVPYLRSLNLMARIDLFLISQAFK